MFQARLHLGIDHIAGHAVNPICDRRADGKLETTPRVRTDEVVGSVQHGGSQREQQRDGGKQGGRYCHQVLAPDARSDVQTKGRGRDGRAWFSDEGGLYLSIMLTPRKAEVVDKIARMTTEVITNTLKSDRGLTGCALKLPNDVICRGKKIAGVLVDAELKGTEAICYLGIGIDLNNGKNWDEEMRKMATSFFLETGKTTNIDDFLVNLLWRLDLGYSSLF